MRAERLGIPFIWLSVLFLYRLYGSSFLDVFMCDYFLYPHAFWIDSRDRCLVIAIAIIMGLKSVAPGDGMAYMAPGEYKKGITASMGCF